MTRKALIAMAAAAVFATTTVAAMAQETVGSVNIPRAAMADGQSLAAGTYTLRVTAEPVPPVVGQTPSESRWVEFVQGDQVRAKALAVVLTPAELKEITESGVPSSGVRVQMLKGNEYLRVWAVSGGTHYLLHLAVTP